MPHILRVIILSTRPRRAFVVKLALLLPLAILFFLVFLSFRLPVIVDNESGKPNYTSVRKTPQIVGFRKDAFEFDTNQIGKLGNMLPNSEDFQKYFEEKPGEMGKPFELKNLTERQEKLVAEGWKRNSFNQFASDLISVRRSVPDLRDEWCKTQKYYKNSTLKATSIIICFDNEAWSVLLRSVHSALDRSPRKLLTEIILVDDFSDMPHLKKPLEDYFAPIKKIRIIRAEKREGLIRARFLGASHASGPILTFLDSHIEATTGWLEPLLSRITEDHTIVVCPEIDVIHNDSLEYQIWNLTLVGGFSWDLQFIWIFIPEAEKKKRNNSVEPVKSPTTVGGLFSIDKAFFNKLGQYDEGFDIWGGENLELSFKTWMCGGTLEIIPCSHVGHIYRHSVPYKGIPGVDYKKKNAVRLAEVWLDEFKEIYYQRIKHDGEYGDGSSRKKLRRDLSCKSFKWFLDTVYPDLFIPTEGASYGEIRNLGLGGEMCLDSPSSQIDLYYKAVGIYPCHGQGGNQFWTYTKTGEIRRDDACLDYTTGSEILLYPCHGNSGNQLWTFEESTKHLVHYSEKCLSILTKETLSIEACNDGEERQMWKLENFDKSKLNIEYFLSIFLNVKNLVSPYLATL